MRYYMECPLHEDLVHKIPRHIKVAIQNDILNEALSAMTRNGGCSAEAIIAVRALKEEVVHPGYVEAPKEGFNW